MTKSVETKKPHGILIESSDFLCLPLGQKLLKLKIPLITMPKIRKILGCDVDKECLEANCNSADCRIGCGRSDTNLRFQVSIQKYDTYMDSIIPIGIVGGVVAAQKLGFKYFYVISPSNKKLTDPIVVAIYQNLMIEVGRWDLKEKI